MKSINGSENPSQLAVPPYLAETMQNTHTDIYIYISMLSLPIHFQTTQFHAARPPNGPPTAHHLRFSDMADWHELPPGQLQEPRCSRSSS